MPKPAHTRVTFEGVIGSAAAPVEHWSFNVNFPAASSGAAATGASLITKATACRGAYAASINGIMGSDIVLTKTRVASVDDTGHVHVRADGSYVQGDWLTVATGTQAPQPAPLQQALCVSLATARPGPTGKGRFFLPWPAKSLDAGDKRLPVIQAQSCLDVSKDFLQQLATAMGADPVVVSSKGYTSAVTTVRLGRTPDTMRSRREDSAEGYLTSPLH